MLSWHNIDEASLHQNPAKYMLWKTIFTINYGSEGELLEKTYIKKHWLEIVPHIDDQKKKALEYILRLV